MAVIGTAEIELLPRSDRFARQTQTDVQRVAQQAATAFIAGAAAQKLKSFFGDAIEGASDLNESVNKTTVVFGESGAEIQRWAEDAATSMGLTSAAALEGASTLGNLFDSLGLTGEQTQEMSTNIVELAADLGSFNNITTDEALVALRAGLVGEIEPLRRLGVNMNDATLRAKALELGLDATTTVLDPAVKAQAAYALILEQTTNAQGDFARTSGDVANQQKIAAAQAKELKTAIGQVLLPAVKLALNGFNALFQVFEALPGPIKAIITGVIAFGGVAVTATAAVIALKAGLLAAGITATGLGTAMLAAAPWVVGLGIAIAGVTALVNSFADAAAEQAKSVDASIGLVEQLTASYAAAVARGDVETAERLLRNLTAAQNDDSLSKEEQLRVTAAADAAMKTYNDAVAAGVDPVEALREGVESLAAAHKEQATQARAARLEELQLAGGFLGLQAAAFSARDAQRSMNEANAEVAAVAGSAGKGTKEYREALREARQAQLGSLEAQVSLTESIGSYVEELIEAGSGVGEVNRVIDEQGRKAGLTGTQIDRLKANVRALIEQYRDVPSEVETEVKATGLAGAQAALDRYLASLKNIGAATLVELTTGGSGGGGGGGGGGRRKGGGGGGGGDQDAPRGVTAVNVNLDGRQIQQEQKRSRILIGGG